MNTWIVALMGLGIGVALGLIGGVRWTRQQATQRLRETTAANERLRATERALAATQAAERERKRIYDDLHDDVGSKLLTLLYRLKTDDEQALTRSILQDLRDIIARSRAASGALQDVLTLLQEEAARRLETLDIRLEWFQLDDLPNPELDDAQAMHLFRIGREAVTNALRHAHPQHLRIVVAHVGADLVFEVTDDGHYPDGGQVGSGRGTQNMQSRAEQLKGEIAWLPGTQGGTKVRLRFPLPTADT